MPAHVFTYLLEVNICLLVFCLFYRIMLHKEVFFVWNRGFIIAAVAFSLLLPLIDVPLSGQIDYLPKTPASPVFSIFVRDTGLVTLPQRQDALSEQAVQQFSATHYLAIIYISVCVLLLAKLVTQIGKLLYFGYTHKQGKYAQYILVYTRGKLPTFSFFRMLFWDNSQQLSEENEEIILKHELTHIRQWHSLDTLLLELLKVVCWFNPVVYLLKKSLEEVHEYLADAAVLKQHNARQYSGLLVEQVFKRNNLSVVHSTSHKFKNA